MWKVGVKPRLSVEQQNQWPPQSTPGHLSQLQPAQPQNRYFGSHKPSFDGWCEQKSFELFGVWVVASFAILFPALSNITLPMLRYGVNVCELQRTVSIFYCDIMNKGNMVTAPCTADQISQSQPAAPWAQWIKWDLDSIFWQVEGCFLGMEHTFCDRPQPRVCGRVTVVWGGEGVLR